MKTAIFTCKPTTLKDLHNPYAMKSSDARPYTITETITLTTAEYDAFGNWLLESRPEFDGMCRLLTSIPPQRAKDIMACWRLRSLSFIFGVSFR